jgi:uncharacterized membrane protein
MENFNRKNRVLGIDQLRGWCIIYVILFHVCFDIELYFMPLPFFHSGIVEVFTFVFRALLFAVSGLSTSFSRNSLKAGVKLVIIGTIITMVSDVFSKGDLTIRFGVLTYLGVSMILYSFLKPITDKFNQYAFFWVCFLLYGGLLTVFPISIYSGITELYPFGITDIRFYSADYFPLIPNFFIFLAGTALIKPVNDHKIPEFYYTADIKPVNFIGRHSLIFYLAHQPIILGIVMLIMFIKTGELPL